LNLAIQKWARKALRQTRRRINEKHLSAQDREKALGELAKISYLMLEA